MVLLEASIRALSWVNGHLLRIGYGIGIAAIAMMVAVTLVQVFFRYVLNNALPWPDEAARFGMLWMTGLMAPIAFRRGGFVAIDILIFALPRAAAAILNIMLLAVSLTVLIVSLKIGWSCWSLPSRSAGRKSPGWADALPRPRSIFRPRSISAPGSDCRAAG